MLDPERVKSRLGHLGHILAREAELVQLAAAEYERQARTGDRTLPTTLQRLDFHIGEIMRIRKEMTFPSEEEMEAMKVGDNS